MARSSAFWREVIDHLPGLILLFRVDENDTAHLIFTNQTITDLLGYSPKEYVLKSESSGKIADELEMLIDEIAQRSHDVDDLRARACGLTSKEGEHKRFNIAFNLFSTTNQKSHLIAVILRSAIQKSLSDSKPEQHEIENQPKLSHSDKKDSKQHLILVSPLMESVWDKLRTLYSSDSHLLLIGEKGVGKKTLCRHLFQSIEPQETIELLDCSAEPLANILAKNHDISKDHAVLFIPEIDQLEKEEQEKLKKWITKQPQERESRANQAAFKIVATSAKPLEQAVENGAFSSALYYTLSFNTVLIPPLRQRPEDIKAIAQAFIDQSKKALRLPTFKANEDEIDKLLKYDWNENIDELFDVLRQSVLARENGHIEFKVTPKKQSELFEENNVSKDDVLAFDEMNRRYLKRILELTEGKIYGDDGAAKLVDLKPTTLQSKLKRLGLR